MPVVMSHSASATLPVHQQSRPQQMPARAPRKSAHEDAPLLSSADALVSSSAVQSLLKEVGVFMWGVGVFMCA